MSNHTLLLWHILAATALIAGVWALAPDPAQPPPDDPAIYQDSLMRGTVAAREVAVAEQASALVVYIHNGRRETYPDQIWRFSTLDRDETNEAWFTLEREWAEREWSSRTQDLHDGWLYELRGVPYLTSRPPQVWRRNIDAPAVPEFVFELPSPFVYSGHLARNDTHFYVAGGSNDSAIWRFPVDDPRLVAEPWLRPSRYWPHRLPGAIAVDDEHLYMAAGWLGEWIWRFPLDDPGAAALWRDLWDPQRFEFKTWTGRTEYEEGAITDLALSERHLWLLINRSYGPDVIWRLELDDPEAGPTLWLELPIRTDWSTTDPEPPISGSVHGIAIGPLP